MNKILALLRIHQWAKNFFIFLPLFFDKRFGDLKLLTTCFIVFLGFSFITSAVYCFNDIIDREDDKKHPLKKKRPIASGDITTLSGWIISFCLIISGGSILFLAYRSISVILIVLLYLILNIAYSIEFKRIAIIDVFIIGIGFVIRIIIGGIIGDITLSHWIVIMTFLLAIFLGFAKRLDDVQIYTKTGVAGRKNIIRYNVPFLYALLMITSTVTVVAYLMYSISDEITNRFGSNYIYLTSLFVILGIFRYLQLTIVDKKGGSPTFILLKDFFIQGCIIAWLLSFALIIYFI
ncbi:UbiA prenyltransferase family protein [Bacteroides sp. 224]|uniref:UbiA prenyltransferase family protein n=1 Tax=Bacteroides sp. 224 TaxID=2302936 RepID=UPI0013D21531|nr:UbiA prenyltransferase family protein [Bacteroides sp. 224]NDV64460.1 prenyltransferase [Bacteroides sp. 224]